MRVILEVIQGPSAGEQFVFERREAFVVGRKKNERVQFPVPGDPYLSRYHMLIEISPPTAICATSAARTAPTSTAKRSRARR